MRLSEIKSAREWQFWVPISHIPCLCNTKAMFYHLPNHPALALGTWTIAAIQPMPGFSKGSISTLTKGSDTTDTSNSLNNQYCPLQQILDWFPQFFWVKGQRRCWITFPFTLQTSLLKSSQYGKAHIISGSSTSEPTQLHTWKAPNPFSGLGLLRQLPK